MTLRRGQRPSRAHVGYLRRLCQSVGVRFVAFWSDIDQLVIPQTHARLEHPDLRARNVLVRGVGHLSLPVDGRVVREIATTLALLDEPGATEAGSSAS